MNERKTDKIKKEGDARKEDKQRRTKTKKKMDNT